VSSVGAVGLLGLGAFSCGLSGTGVLEVLQVYVVLGGAGTEFWCISVGVWVDRGGTLDCCCIFRICTSILCWCKVGVRCGGSTGVGTSVFVCGVSGTDVLWLPLVSVVLGEVGAALWCMSEDFS